MAIPVNTLAWSEPMDPSDIVDYAIDVQTLLDTGELVAGFSIIPYSESALLGLNIGSGDRAPELIETKLTMWLSISDHLQSSDYFEGSGSLLPIQVTVETSSVPPRRKQRTVVVRVQQR